MIRLRSFVPLLGIAVLAAGAVTASAQSADPAGVISVLATNAITGPFAAIAEEHRRQTGQQVNVEFDTSPSINRRFAAGTIAGVQVLIAATATVDQAITDGRADRDTRIRVGRVGIGVAVRRGALRPDISSVDALKASLLNADAVVYSQGASGIYVAQMLEMLGLLGQLERRAVQLATGADMVERIEQSRGNEIGMTQISEITLSAEEGGGALVYVGPLPAAVQHYTAFDAVAMTGAPEAARAFVRSLSAAPARRLLAANYWEF
ncbi:MAG TPA: substrate-binding domain-containing protein [Gammaproteobacteria bacterium]|jgi:molybdate transport system substrate-binding protein